METLMAIGAEEDMEVGVDLLKRRRYHRTFALDTCDDSAHKRNVVNADGSEVEGEVKDEAHVTEIEEMEDFEDAENGILPQVREGAEYRNGYSGRGSQGTAIGVKVISGLGVSVALSNRPRDLGGGSVVKEDVQELSVGEPDVERVIAEQETHDLFCPNCRSCITKRVILRRRKRKTKEISICVRCEKTSEEGYSDNITSSVNEKDDTGPDVFRCISCFSIFIPTGNCFKLWRRSGDTTAPNANEVSLENASKTTNEAVRQGKDVIILIPDEPVLSRIPALDFTKAIVFGGLLETITSLGVVTSAVGSDTATLNVLALGVANVIGGLFVLAHSLRVLKRETSIERYKEQIGCIGNFPFHVIIAVISYLVFGLMSPVVYCFSFQESDNRNLKLITLGSSALLCIILLAVGKAHVQKPPKYTKTLVYYVSLGIMVSGASFVAGDLIQGLQVKRGWFRPNYPFTSSASEVASAAAAWAAS